MVFNIFYRPPAHKLSNSFRSGFSNRKLFIPATPNANHQKAVGNEIPEALSFDRIVAGSTNPPMTVRDFMRYLLYVCHAAENLQFFLWLKDYEERFAKLTDGEKALSPEWHQNTMESPAFPPPAHRSGRRPRKDVVNFFANTFANNGGGSAASTSGNRTSGPPSGEGFDPLATPLRTPCHASSNLGSIAPFLGSTDTSLKVIDHKEVAAEAFKAVDLKWEPFTVQPFREEISKIIAIYIAEGSPRELNVSARDRISVLHALGNTTHPSALNILKRSVDDVLRNQAHPAFVRWSIYNGNRPRVVFARFIGVALTLLGFLVSILFTLSGKCRGLRALGAIGWLLGITTLIAALKGLCMVLHGVHHRHVRPWELLRDNNKMKTFSNRDPFDTFGTKNSYENEPWVSKYKNRFLIRKIFDREVYIEEPALRKIQNMIVIQSIIIGVIFTAVLSAVFLSLPERNLF